jgi:hypothetical protein
MNPNYRRSEEKYKASLRGLPSTQLDYRPGCGGGCVTCDFRRSGESDIHLLTRNS